MANTTNKKNIGSQQKRPTKKMQEQLALEQQRKYKDTVRIISVVVFAVSVFIFCVALIEGNGLWQWLHNAYLGLFGFGAYLLPFVAVGAAVITALDKKKNILWVKVAETAVMILFICSFIHVCKFQYSGSYLDTCFDAYRDATLEINGGFFGAIIGELFLSFGKAGAIITNILLLFVTFMLLSGLTLIQFLKSLLKPVKKTQEQIKPVIEQQIEKRRIKKFNIDVPIDNIKSEQESEKLSREVPKEEQVKEDIDEDIKEIQEIFKPKTKKKKNAQPNSEALDDIIKKVTGAEVPPLKPEPKKKADSKSASIPMEISDEAMNSKIENYKLPPIDLLNRAKKSNTSDISDELKANAEKLVNTLRSFGVETKIVDISRGPTVTRYELKPSVGVRISKVTGLADDIALNLAASGVRIEAPIPNKAAIGIEVPNKVKNMVSMRELIENDDFYSSKSKLYAGLGKDISGNGIYCDVAKMPHLLVAGATGAGKSVCINSIIVSMLYRATPDEVKFVMIDPKQVEFTMYQGIPHLLVPVVTDPRKAAGALGWAVSEMLKRYKLFSENGVKNIQGYNKLADKSEDIKRMPQIVIFIDELADLMMAAPKEVEESICRLAQLARAAGMHLVIATQRPSVDVITGLIKANIPSRIALTVSSQIDSRTILDTAGAEKLLGYGDMLYNPVGLSKPTRVQGCFVDEDEIEKIVSFIKSQGECSYDDEIAREIEEKTVVEKKKGNPFTDEDEADDIDPLFSKAVDVVMELGSASTSVIQRKLKVGYARGARIVDQMEEKGIIGPAEGSKARKVLISKTQWLEMCANTDNGIEQLPLSELANQEQTDIEEEE